MASLLALPPEILLEILGYLSNRDLLILSQLGSRVLRKASLNKYFLKAAFIICIYCAHERATEPMGRGILLSDSKWLLYSTLQRCKDTPTFTKCITELCLQYDVEHSSSCAGKFICRYNQPWEYRYTHSPHGTPYYDRNSDVENNESANSDQDMHYLRAKNMAGLDQTILAVNILRELTQLDTLNMSLLSAPMHLINSGREQFKLVWHLLCVAAFTSARPVFAPPKKLSEERDIYYTITEKEMREGPQYLKKLRVLRCSGNIGYISLLTVLPAFFFPKIESITVYNVREEGDENCDSISTWFRQAMAEGPNNAETKAPAPGIPDSLHKSSNITNLDFRNAWLTKKTLTSLLLLPRKLKRFSFKHMNIESGQVFCAHHEGEFDGAYSGGRLLHPRDILQTLHQSPVGATLEDIRLDYLEMIQDSHENEDADDNPPVGWLGSFAGFSSLKRLSVPLWVLSRPCSTNLNISPAMSMGGGMRGEAPTINNIWEILPSTLEGLDIVIHFPWHWELDVSPNRNALWFDQNVCIPVKHILCSSTGNPRFVSLREIFLSFQGYGYGIGKVPDSQEGYTFSGVKYLEFRRWLVKRLWMWTDVERTAHQLGVKVRMKNHGWLEGEWVDDGLEIKMHAPQARILHDKEIGGFFLLNHRA